MAYLRECRQMQVLLGRVIQMIMSLHMAKPQKTVGMCQRLLIPTHTHSGASRATALVRNQKG